MVGVKSFDEAAILLADIAESLLETFHARFRSPCPCCGHRRGSRVLADQHHRQAGARPFSARNRATSMAPGAQFAAPPCRHQPRGPSLSRPFRARARRPGADDLDGEDQGRSARSRSRRNRAWSCGSAGRAARSPSSASVPVREVGVVLMTLKRHQPAEDDLHDDDPARTCRIMSRCRRVRKTWVRLSRAFRAAQCRPFGATGQSARVRLRPGSARNPH